MAIPAAAFGPGILIGSRTDVSPSIPINVGYVQEFTIDVTGTTKQLYGQNQFPLVAARGTIKATAKFKTAVVSGYALQLLFYGQSAAFNGTAAAWNIDSTFTASSGTTSFNVTSFDQDLGVRYGSSALSTGTAVPIGGLPLLRTSSTVALGQGQYYVTSTGGYNFSTADAYSTLTGGVGPVALKVTYTSSTGANAGMLVTNQLIGVTPTIQLDYYTNLNQPTQSPFAVRLYQAVPGKYVWAFKLEDFNIPEFDVDLFADNSGRVFNKVFPNLS